MAVTSAIAARSSGNPSAALLATGADPLSGQPVDPSTSAGLGGYFGGGAGDRMLQANLASLDGNSSTLVATAAIPASPPAPGNLPGWLSNLVSGIPGLATAIRAAKFLSPAQIFYMILTWDPWLASTALNRMSAADWKSAIALDDDPTWRQQRLNEAIELGVFAPGTTLADLGLGPAPQQGAGAPPTPPVTAPPASVPNVPVDTGPTPEELREQRLEEAQRIADQAREANLKGELGTVDPARVAAALEELWLAGRINHETYEQRSTLLNDAQRYSSAMRVIYRLANEMEKGATAVGDVTLDRIERELATIQSTPGVSTTIQQGRDYAQDIVNRFKARLILNAAEAGGANAPTHNEINNALLTVQRLDPINVDRARRLYEQSHARTHPRQPVPPQPAVPDTGRIPNTDAAAGAPSPMPPNNDDEAIRRALRQALETYGWTQTAFEIADQGARTFGAVDRAVQLNQEENLTLAEIAQAIQRGFNGEQPSDATSPATAAFMEVGRNTRNMAVIGLTFRLGPVQGSVLEAVNAAADVRQSGGSAADQVIALTQTLVTNALFEQAYQATTVGDVANPLVVTTPDAVNRRLPGADQVTGTGTGQPVERTPIGELPPEEAARGRRWNTGSNPVPTNVDAREYARSLVVASVTDQGGGQGGTAVTSTHALLDPFSGGADLASQAFRRGLERLTPEQQALVRTALGERGQAALAPVFQRAYATKEEALTAAGNALRDLYFANPSGGFTPDGRAFGDFTETGIMLYADGNGQWRAVPQLVVGQPGGTRAGLTMPYLPREATQTAYVHLHPVVSDGLAEIAVTNDPLGPRVGTGDPGLNQAGLSQADLDAAGWFRSFRERHYGAGEEHGIYSIDALSGAIAGSTIGRQGEPTREVIAAAGDVFPNTVGFGDSSTPVRLMIDPNSDVRIESSFAQSDRNSAIVDALYGTDGTLNRWYEFGVYTDPTGKDPFETLQPDPRLFFENRMPPEGVRGDQRSNRPGTAQPISLVETVGGPNSPLGRIVRIFEGESPLTGLLNIRDPRLTIGVDLRQPDLNRSITLRLSDAVDAIRAYWQSLNWSEIAELNRSGRSQEAVDRVFAPLRNLGEPLANLPSLETITQLYLEGNSQEAVDRVRTAVVNLLLRIGAPFVETRVDFASLPEPVQLLTGISISNNVRIPIDPGQGDAIVYDRQGVPRVNATRNADGTWTLNEDLNINVSREYAGGTSSTSYLGQFLGMFELFGLPVPSATSRVTYNFGDQTLPAGTRLPDEVITRFNHALAKPGLRTRESGLIGVPSSEATARFQRLEPGSGDGYAYIDGLIPRRGTAELRIEGRVSLSNMGDWPGSENIHSPSPGSAGVIGTISGRTDYTFGADPAEDDPAAGRPGLPEGSAGGIDPADPDTALGSTTWRIRDDLRVEPFVPPDDPNWGKFDLSPGRVGFVRIPELDDLTDHSSQSGSRLDDDLSTANGYPLLFASGTSDLGYELYTRREPDPSPTTDPGAILIGTPIEVPGLLNSDGSTTAGLLDFRDPSTGAPIASMPETVDVDLTPSQRDAIGLSQVGGIFDALANSFGGTDPEAQRAIGGFADLAGTIVDAGGLSRGLTRPEDVASGILGSLGGLVPGEGGEIIGRVAAGYDVYRAIDGFASNPSVASGVGAANAAAAVIGDPTVSKAVRIGGDVANIVSSYTEPAKFLSSSASIAVDGSKITNIGLLRGASIATLASSLVSALVPGETGQYISTGLTVAAAAMAPTPLAVVGAALAVASLFMDNRPATIPLGEGDFDGAGGSNDTAAFATSDSDFLYRIRDGFEELPLDGASFRLHAQTVRARRDEDGDVTGYEAVSSDDRDGETKYYLSARFGMGPIHDGIDRATSFATERFSVGDGGRDGDRTRVSGFEISKAEYDRLRRLLGGDQGSLSAGDERLALLRPYLAEAASEAGGIRYEQRDSGRGFHRFSDVNGDGIRDLIRQDIDLGEFRDGDGSAVIEIKDHTGRTTLTFEVDELDGREIARSYARALAAVTPDYGPDGMIGPVGTFGPLLGFGPGGATEGSAVVGGPGKDRLDAGAGDDLVTGGAGADTLLGRGGDDLLEGGAGADRLDGGRGSDLASYATAEAPVVADLASGSVTEGGAPGDTLVAIEGVIGGTAADRLFGDRAENFLGGGAGDDTLLGRAGKDLLSGSFGADRLDGGRGADVVSYTDATAGVVVDLGTGTAGDLGTTDPAAGAAAGDTIVNVEGVSGSAFADRLTGDGGQNLLAGGAGDDVLQGAAGNDLVRGGTGADVATGDAGNDQILGEEGDDTITDRAGSNAVDGGAGNDAVTTGAGQDQVAGGAGADTIVAGAGNDTVSAGAGNDTVTLGAGDDRASAGAGVDTVTAGRGNDVVAGNAGADVLMGQGGQDLISGGAGADSLQGGLAADTLNAGRGADHVDAGRGNDVVSAGRGNDVIVAGAGSDRIDGGRGKRDVLVLEGRRDQYEIIDLGDGRYQIVDKRRGRDGVDTVTGIERIRFADGGFAIAAVAQPR